MVPVFAGSVTKQTTEHSLGVASSLEVWWRPGPAANYPGVAIFRLVATGGERRWLYGGGAVDFFMTNPEKIVAYTSEIISRERKKGNLKILFEQQIIISGAPPSERVSSGMVVAFFFGEGDWDRPITSPITIPEWAILQGQIHPPVVIDPNKDKLSATFELGVPAKERIRKEWQYGSGGGP